VAPEGVTTRLLGQAGYRVDSSGNLWATDAAGLTHRSHEGPRSKPLGTFPAAACAYESAAQ
jgi:hypothetical protein